MVVSPQRRTRQSEGVEAHSNDLIAIKPIEDPYSKLFDFQEEVAPQLPKGDSTQPSPGGLQMSNLKLKPMMSSFI